MLGITTRARPTILSSSVTLIGAYCLKQCLYKLLPLLVWNLGCCRVLDWNDLKSKDWLMAANQEVKAPRLTGRPKIHHGYETRLAFEVLFLDIFLPCKCCCLRWFLWRSKCQHNLMSTTFCAIRTFFNISVQDDSYGYTFGSEADEANNYRPLTSFRLYPIAYLPSKGGHSHGGRVEFTVRMSNRYDLIH